MCQLILLAITIFLWVFFIGGADSLMDNGLLAITAFAVAFSTACCHFIIKDKDIEQIFHIKRENNEV